MIPFIEQLTPSVWSLGLTQGASVLFWTSKLAGKRLGMPLAVMHGDVVYFPDNAEPAHQRAINEWYPHMPHCRVAERDFRFVLGSSFTLAGLPLTRLEPKEPT